MSTTLKELYENNNIFKLNLCAGHKGISNTVTWVYYSEDTTTTNFIKGNELVLTTCLANSNSADLLNYINNLIKNNASGLIINTGKYIKKIPKSVIDLCNKKNFPLFTMPWEIHLVDIMQSFSNEIILNNQKEKNVSNAFKWLIFNDNNINSDAKEILLQNNYNLEGNYLLIKVSSKIENKDCNISYKNISNSINSKFINSNIKYSYIFKDNSLLLLFNNIMINDLSSICDILNSKSQGELYIGISSIKKSIDSIKTLYKEALYSFTICNLKKKDIIHYDDIGIYKLILDVNDKYILKEMYDKTLGKLETYDKLHNTNYLDTLKLYLFNSCSVQKVASITYTHRNTINYRIKKIKSLTKCNFENTDTRLLYEMSYYIKEILNIKRDF
ncbi:MAG: PucR family transcriptional regulator ligand-binding domain-containing protein [Clostridiales bacterium]|nr:PucR family transcriptional regulator ligand-binding domain-containing protein [Clostridiales bacterium]MDY2728516.1 PucR family transcriptional regulator ligand-binding domain-containing protein [Clostridium sp.]